MCCYFILQGSLMPGWDKPRQLPKGTKLIPCTMVFELRNEVPGWQQTGVWQVWTYHRISHHACLRKECVCDVRRAGGGLQE